MSNSNLACEYLSRKQGERTLHGFSEIGLSAFGRRQALLVSGLRVFNMASLLSGNILFSYIVAIVLLCTSHMNLTSYPDEIELTPWGSKSFSSLTFDIGVIQHNNEVTFCIIVIPKKENLLKETKEKFQKGVLVEISGVLSGQDDKKCKEIKGDFQDGVLVYKFTVYQRDLANCYFIFTYVVYDWDLEECLTNNYYSFTLRDFLTQKVYKAIRSREEIDAYIENIVKAAKSKFKKELSVLTTEEVKAYTRYCIRKFKMCILQRIPYHPYQLLFWTLRMKAESEIMNRSDIKGIFKYIGFYGQLECFDIKFSKKNLITLYFCIPNPREECRRLPYNSRDLPYLRYLWHIRPWGKITLE